jgi:hypothetical protein
MRSKRAESTIHRVVAAALARVRREIRAGATELARLRRQEERLVKLVRLKLYLVQSKRSSSATARSYQRRSTKNKIVWLPQDGHLRKKRKR